MVDTVAVFDGDLTIGADHTAVVSRHVGGQAANTATWLGWLQSPVALIAALGSDPDGTWIRERLRIAGVQILVHEVEARTGHCLVTVAADGTRTMFSDAGANTHLAGHTSESWIADIQALPTPVHLHLSGYLLTRNPALPARLVTAVRGACPEVTTSLDAAALSPTAAERKGLADLLPHLDVILGTREELSEVVSLPGPSTSSAAILDYWQAVLGFSGVVVIKEGPEGASAVDGASQMHVPALPAEVVDTTGAGDAFTAGFLAAWTLGPDDLSAALLAGHRAASVAITSIGAEPPDSEGR